MKKIIITLALVALASTAGAQHQSKEITLPQYLPPSYHSPHGGTGLADTPTVAPRAPIEWPSGSQGHGGTADTYVVPYNRPPANASPEETVKAVEDYYRRRYELNIQNLKRLEESTKR
jgi:hypothetical protein